MKKLATILTTGLLVFSSISRAEMMDYLKDYGLPCLAGFAGGYLASKSNGGAIGLGVCFGVGTSTYIQSQKQAQKMRDEDFKQFMKLMDTQSAKNLAEQDLKLDKVIKNLEEKQTAQAEALRQVMKEVVAERIVLIGEDLKKDIKLYVEKNDFLQDLEKKVMIKLKEEVQSESKVRQKEIVNECVDEALRQLVLKKVGTQTDL